MNAQELSRAMNGVLLIPDDEVLGLMRKAADENPESIERALLRSNLSPRQAARVGRIITLLYGAMTR